MKKIFFKKTLGISIISIMFLTLFFSCFQVSATDEDIELVKPSISYRNPPGVGKVLIIVKSEPQENYMVKYELYRNGELVEETDGEVSTFFKYYFNNVPASNEDKFYVNATRDGETVKSNVLIFVETSSKEHNAPFLNLIQRYPIMFSLLERILDIFWM